MASETVEQVCDEMKEVTGIKRFIDSHYCNNCGEPIDGEGSPLDVYADRALAAHKRDLTAKDEEIKQCKNAMSHYEKLITDAKSLIEQRDALIKELADAVFENMTAQCEHCDLRQACQEGEDGIVVPCNQVIKLREALTKAREVTNG